MKGILEKGGEWFILKEKGTAIRDCRPFSGLS
jgi:hypothetical protein